MSPDSGGLGRLASHPADDRVQELVEGYTRRIERAARRELALVDDLLSLTIIEGDAEVLSDGLADLIVVAETGPPAVVRAHEGWLERAVRCLLDNALKFTPPGGLVTVAPAPRARA